MIRRPRARHLPTPHPPSSPARAPRPTTLAGLAVAVALVAGASACAGDDGASGNGSAAGGTTTPAGAPGTGPGPDEAPRDTTALVAAHGPIGAVDFADRNYSPDACGTTIPNLPDGLFLGGGALVRAPEVPADVSVRLRPDIAYGDLTGDGQHEAVITLECTKGNQTVAHAWVYTPDENGADGARRLAAVTYPPGAEGASADGGPVVVSVSVENGRLVSRWSLPAGGSGTAARQATVTQRWTGSGWEDAEPVKVTG